MPNERMPLWFVGLTLLVAATPALAGAPATNAPDPMNGQELASRLCSNCHLVGSGQQEQANADIPSFHEIANKQSTMPNIIVEKDDMLNVIAYILSLKGRDKDQSK